MNNLEENSPTAGEKAMMQAMQVLQKVQNKK